MNGLAGKVFLVTGGGSGIGAATVLRLLDERAMVVAGDINPDGLAATAARAAGVADLLAVEFDLAEEGSIVALVEAAIARFGALHGVANVASDVRRSTLDRDVPVDSLDPAFWLEVMKTNLIGTGIVIREAFPHLIAAGGGAIVNISSDGSAMGGLGSSAYASSKAGLNALTRHTATLGGTRNIRCNALSPGMVMSAAGKARPASFSQAFLDKMALKRLGEPEDLAGPIAFLLSDDASWLTGQTISVDGGLIFRE